MAWGPFFFQTADAMGNISRLLGVYDRERYESFRDVLQGDVDQWLNEAKRADITQADKSHFFADWFGGAWWPELDADTMVDTFRAGFTAAFDAALTYSMPLEVVWVTPVGYTEFAVEHHVGVNVVTVAIVTPVPSV